MAQYPGNYFASIDFVSHRVGCPVSLGGGSSTFSASSLLVVPLYNEHLYLTNFTYVTLVMRTRSMVSVLYSAPHTQISSPDRRRRKWLAKIAGIPSLNDDTSNFPGAAALVGLLDAARDFIVLTRGHLVYSW